MKRRASCSCGQLQLTCLGEPVRISICHCLACQKRTGTAFGYQARFPRDRVTEISGTAVQYKRHADSGRMVTFNFCPSCGSTVYWEGEHFPDLIAVAVGCFSDSGFPAPRYSVYETHRHHWVAVPAEAEHSG
jgi:hypothetical protein